MLDIGYEGTYEEIEHVEDQGQVELCFASPVVLRQYKWVRINELSLLPAPPMSYTLPDCTHNADQLEKISQVC
jgi:hypothetical protein